MITATKMFEGQPRLITEASAHGVPSIYPSFGGLDEYFPDDYKLFKQFDYPDLVKKIYFCNIKNCLIEESKKIYNHTIEIMSLNKLNKELEYILNQMNKVIETPLISVLFLSVYNDDENIKKSIDSILSQSYKNIELLVIDDGSTDKTYEIISNINDSRLKIFRNKDNLGLTKCLNILIKITRTNFS